MARTFDPARHRRFGRELARGDVFADRAVAVARARDALRRRRAVASGMAEVVVAGHVGGLGGRRAFQRLIPVERARRPERLVTAAPLLSARVIDEHERALSHLRAGEADLGRERRGEHDPDLVAAFMNAQLREFFGTDLVAELLGQQGFELRAQPPAAEGNDPHLGGAVSRRLERGFKRRALRQSGGRAVERVVGFDWGRVHGAGAVHSAQAVDDARDFISLRLHPRADREQCENNTTQHGLHPGRRPAIASGWGRARPHAGLRGRIIRHSRQYPALHPAPFPRGKFRVPPKVKAGFRTA